MTTSSIIPSDLTKDWSARCKTVVFCQIFLRLSLFIVFLVMTLIDAPKSISVLEREMPFIFTLTMGLPGLEYLAGRVLPIINLEKSPIT